MARTKKFKFPVSGVYWGPNNLVNKRGFYHYRTDLIFRPRWGIQSGVYNPSDIPDGSQTRLGADSSAAFLRPHTSTLRRMYALNECAYVCPAARAQSGQIRSYIMSVLDAHRNGVHSGIGREDVVCVGLNDNAHSVKFNLDSHAHTHTHKNTLAQKHIVSDTLKNEAMKVKYAPSLNPYIQRGRIHKLWQVVSQSQIWRGQASHAYAHKHNSTKFPYVDKSASAIRDLTLSEVLYTRSDHRAKNIRHPFWARRDARLKKFHYKYKKRLEAYKAETTAAPDL